MKLKTLLAVCAALLLAACAGAAKKDVASFDLGAASVAWKPAEPGLRGVGVFAPSWLGAPAMHYRLLYADPQRRLAYAESRWAAAPGELIERALNRQTSPRGACRLRLDLDELAQVFDAPATSRVLLEARATLVGPNRDAVLARKAFAVAQPAPSADARGSAAAAAAAVQALGGELGLWLEQAARETPAIVQRCRGAQTWQTSTTPASTRPQPTTRR